MPTIEQAKEKLDLLRGEYAALGEKVTKAYNEANQNDD